MGSSGDPEAQWVSGDGNVVVSHVSNSRVEIAIGAGRRRDVALRPGWSPFPDWAEKHSLAALLLPGFAVVPFVDAGGVLERLVGWARSETAVAGAVVAGGAGTGKTRLATELSRALLEGGWVTGFLRPSSDSGALEALADASVPRCVLIDYAEAKAEVIAKVVDRLARTGTTQAPIRFVLLTRAVIDGSHDVRPTLRGRSGDLDVLLENADFIELTSPRWSDLDTRREFFNAAAKAIGERTRQPAPRAPDGLDADLYDRPLTIAIAAGLGCFDDEALPDERGHLVDRLLDYEAQHWERTAERLHLTASPALLRQVAAFATLAGAATSSEASDVIGRIPELSDASVERRAELARWMSEAYPGPLYWQPVEPDLVGEHLVAKVIGEEGNTLAAAMANRDPAGRARQPVELLARAAASYPTLAKAWAEALDHEFGDLVNQAISEAAETSAAALFDESLAEVLTYALTQLDLRAETLMSASDALAHPDLVLNPLRLVLSQELAARHRELVESDPGAKPVLAISLDRLGTRLSELGRRDEALLPTEEAVAIRRELAQADPPRELPGLAASLNNLSNRLSEVGRRNEAIAPIEEALEIRRRLAQANADAYQAELATSLNNHSDRLFKVGRRDEALASTEEALAIRQKLALADPDTHLPHLAASLNNHSVQLRALGRRDEALAPIEDAIDIHRQLVEANPARHLPALAGSLNTLSHQLSDLGHGEEALAPIEEATDIHRQLADANPAAHQPALATSLNNLGVQLGELGRSQEALAPVEEAIGIHRQLVDANASAHQPALATSLNNLSNRFRELDRLDEALAATEEVVGIRRKLAQENPAAHQAGFLQSLKNLVSILDALGRDSSSVRSELRQLADDGE